MHTNTNIHKTHTCIHTNTHTHTFTPSYYESVKIMQWENFENIGMTCPKSSVLSLDPNESRVFYFSGFIRLRNYTLWASVFESSAYKIHYCSFLLE